ncbi:condensation domain-containing protein [Actinocrispum wychmicini]|uniref:Thioesterase superfamily protein n=1 Tax=Actinocrispum wychmicini TaxID=1213861 RepID=A0A4R2JTX3_9PSEU|nr:condensation domain-containing protein [Actinocrispum wychmicini]TCO60706.1 thioesterase superfamily protein [Actinocrispum wychmicini]
MTQAVKTLPRAVPASAMMEALWWVHHRAKNKSVYNLTWRLACDKALDPAALAVAWQALADRHEALRGTLHQRDGAIELAIADHVETEPEWVTIDDPGSVPATELIRLIAEEIHSRSFDLDQAPLARLTSVTVGDERELLVTFQHALVDGWAVQLLMADFSTAYVAAVNGKPPVFDTEPPSLREYVVESQAARTDGRWDTSVKYWRDVLDGAVTTTVVADHHRYTGTGGKGEMLRFALSDDAVDGIAALAKQYFTTPFVIVLAAFQATLGHGGGGPDVCTGVVTANRMTQQEQALVGYTANLMLARTRVSGDESFGDVIERVRDDMWASLAHQAVPFPVVYGGLTETAQTRLRDAIPMLLNYLGPIGNDLSLGDVGLHMRLAPNRAARTDMGIGILETDDGYLIDCEYNSGRYERETALRLFHDMDAVLSAGGADSNVRMSTFDIRTKTGPAYVEHQLTPADIGATEMPKSAALDQVRRAWTEVLGTGPAGPDEDFFATGGRSLKVVQLMSTIEAETGVALDVARWLTEPTPRRAADQISAEDTGADGTLIELRAGTGGPHVHLLQGAGGSVQDYRDLTAALPADWRITVSQERTPMTSVPEMAQVFRADLDGRPDLLVGWSMGGQVAFEMAAAYPGVPVAAIDSTPPLGYEPGDDFDELVYDTFAAAMAGSLGATLDGSPARTSAGDPELAMAVLAAHLTAAAGQPVSTAMLLDRWTTFRRHTVAATSYASQHRLGGPALIVGADLADYQLDQWSEQFTRPPTRLRVAADHYSLLKPPAITEIAAAITRLRQQK